MRGPFREKESDRGAKFGGVAFERELRFAVICWSETELVDTSI